MTGSIPPPKPLAYEGQVVVPSIQRNFPPNTSFNNFPVPTIWIDPEHENAYMLVSKASGIANWVLLGSVPSSLQTITTPDGIIVSPISGNINFLNGTGMAITGSENNITFNSSGFGIAWSTITTSTQNAEVNNGYIANNGAGVTFLLPTLAKVGDMIGFVAMNSGGFTISQNDSQQIQIGKFNTTMGATGSLASTQIGDMIFLLCTVANTNFIVVDMIGDITYV